LNCCCISYLNSAKNNPSKLKFFEKTHARKPFKYVNKGRVVIMAKEPIELTTDVPEHAFLEVSNINPSIKFIHF